MANFEALQNDACVQLGSRNARTSSQAQHQLAHKFTASKRTVWLSTDALKIAIFSDFPFWLYEGLNTTRLRNSAKTSSLNFLSAEIDFKSRNQPRNTFKSKTLLERSRRDFLSPEFGQRRQGQKPKNALQFFVEFRSFEQVSRPKMGQQFVFLP